LREPDIKGGFLLAERISHQPGNQIDKEVERAAMAGMLDLGDVFELVIDGLDDRAFA
jgi:hypothetical protein